MRERWREGREGRGEGAKGKRVEGKEGGKWDLKGAEGRGSGLQALEKDRRQLMRLVGE